MLICRSFQIILFVILGVLASCSQSEELKLSMLDDKPVFTVSVEGFNLAYSVILNGVRVYAEQNHSGQVSLTVPVNHYMHPKENYLAIDAVPPEPGGPFKPNARVKATLNVHNLGSSDDKLAIATMVFRESAQNGGSPTEGSSSAGRYKLTSRLEEDPEGRIEIGEILAKDSSNYEGSKLFERELLIPNVLPLWAFFSSDKMPDYFTIPDDEYYPELESLLKEYLKVQSALETGDIEKVIPLFKERNRETDLAFYREPGTTEQGIREDLIKSANADNLELTPLTADMVQLIPEENRKLVKLVRSDDGPAIGLDFVEGQGAVVYDLVFRRENGEWILTR